MTAKPSIHAIADRNSWRAPRPRYQSFTPSVASRHLPRRGRLGNGSRCRFYFKLRKHPSQPPLRGRLGNGLSCRYDYQLRIHPSQPPLRGRWHARRDGRGIFRLHGSPRNRRKRVPIHRVAHHFCRQRTARTSLRSNITLRCGATNHCVRRASLIHPPSDARPRSR